MLQKGNQILLANSEVLNIVPSQDVLVRQKSLEHPTEKALACTLERGSPTVSGRFLRDCLKTGPEACWQVDTFSGHLTGAQSPQNNMITSI
jgi:hypothetical protein